MGGCDGSVPSPDSGRAYALPMVEVDAATRMSANSVFATTITVADSTCGCTGWQTTATRRPKISRASPASHRSRSGGVNVCTPAMGSDARHRAAFRPRPCGRGRAAV